MNSLIRFYILGFLNLACLGHCLQAQTGIRTILQFKGNTLYFNNSDSMDITSLKNTDSQLIILVFHAEEDTIGMDPGLSVNGRWRAIHLDKLFKSIDFKGFFTTPFRNNILTIQPLMDSKNAKPGYYDQADIYALSESIKKIYPSPAIIVVHPQTVCSVFEQLSMQKCKIDVNGNLSEKIIFIQRNKISPSSWNEFKYSIR